MNVCRKVLLMVIMCSAISSSADVVNVNPGLDISSTDLFEGATVVNYYNILGGFDARDAFGGAYGLVEIGTVIATTPLEGDDVSWIHFRTAGAVTANEFTISLGQDGGSGIRSSSLVYMQTSSSGGAVWDDTIFSQGLDVDYLGTYGDNSINVNAVFDDAVTSEDWLFVWQSKDTEQGARVFEVDAVIPEPATIGLIALAGMGMLWVRRRVLPSEETPV